MQGLPCLHPPQARPVSRERGGGPRCGSAISLRADLGACATGRLPATAPDVPAPPLPAGTKTQRVHFTLGKCSLPLPGLGDTAGAGDPTRAGLTGEWELLDLWGGGVAVIVRLLDPPVRSLPKEDPEKKGELGL